MAGMSDYLENAVLNLTLRGVAFTAVATPYVSLHTADPGDTGTSELTDAGYARKSGSFGAPVAGVASIDAEIVFNAIADAGPFTITHVGIWDAASSGNLLYTGALDQSKTFFQTDVPRFPTASLTATAT